MKKFHFPALITLGALSLSLILSACGGKDVSESTSPAPTDTPAISESAAPSELPDSTGSTEPSDAPETSPAESSTPSSKPQGTAKPSSKPSEAPSQAPSEAPSEKPSEGSKVQAVWDSISQLELPAFMDMDKDVLSALYGIDESDLVEYIGKVPLMNVQATEFFIAQVQLGKMDTVKADIAKRQADLESQWSQYLPEQLELVKNYKLVTSGDYVMFAVTQYADQAVNAFNDCTK